VVKLDKRCKIQKTSQWFLELNPATEKGYGGGIERNFMGKKRKKGKEPLRRVRTSRDLPT